MAKRFTITFDAADTMALSHFWKEALGYEFELPPAEFETWDEFADKMGIPEEDRDRIAAIEDPDGRGPRLLFLKVPEGKTAKNRMHLDVHARDERSGGPDQQRAAVEAEVDRLVALGATAGDSHDEHGSIWTVLRDPEGNEFCVV